MDKTKEIMEILISASLEKGQKLSLASLREVYLEIPFSEEESRVACNLLAKAHMACFNLAAENAIFAIQYFAELGDKKALTELYRLTKLYDNQEALKLLDSLDSNFPLPTTDKFYCDWDNNPDVDFLFRQYCSQNDLVILKKMQAGVKEIKYCSNVYLVLDKDGIIKVFKELLTYKDGPLGQFCNNEDEVYELLKNSELARNYYGKVKIAEDISFLKFPYIFGELLSEKIEREEKFPFSEACTIVVQIAKKLKALHERGIVHHDLKPEHVILGDNEVNLVDFGVSRISGGKRVEAYLATPRYGTPEESVDLRVSCASDVFQLGVIFYEMLTGQHPFAMGSSLSEDDLEEKILKFFWPSATISYNEKLLEGIDEEIVNLISQMLSKNPAERPPVDTIITRLEKFYNQVKVKRQQKINDRKKNTLLFPARMGLPHKGHIEYISRLIELGFHVIISLQRTYTITDRDPFPKSLIMKMIAQSLLDQGIARDNFSFIFTPFYQSQEEMRMHFVMMPYREDIVGVASSNFGITKLFPEYFNFDQKTVFGREGEWYEDKSWGTILREAVKSGDYKNFIEYAASGVEKIIPFESLRKRYAEVPVEFVPGRVEIFLLGDDGEEIVRTRALRYLSPEQSLVTALRRQGFRVELFDDYTRESLVLFNNKMKTFSYRGIRFDGENVFIYYDCT